MNDRKFPTILIAGLLGLLNAFTISVTLYPNDLNSLLEWVVTLSLMTLGFGLLFFLLLPGARKRVQGLSTGVKFWGMTLSLGSTVFFSLFTGPGFVLLFFLAGVILTSFTLSSLSEILIEKRASRFFLAWGLGGLASFFAVGYFENFYPGLLEFSLLSIFFIVLLTMLFDGILAQAIPSLKNDPKEKLISIVVLVLGLALLILTVQLLLPYPAYFSPDFFLPEPSLIPAFFGILVLMQGWAALALRKSNPLKWQASPLFLWITRNLPGLLLAFPIAVSTYLYETALVSYDLAFMDIFFQMDSPWWLNYLTLKADEMLTMRFVHPFVLLILRPPVWLISLFLNGDRYHAALLLNAAIGGLCVVLAWLFFKKRTANAGYALLMAALLGFSTSHLALSSFLESYIFSAAALITFFMLVQSRETKFWQLVVAGLVTFGITITNFIQTCIDVFVIRPDRWIIFKYMLYVLSFAVLLALIQNIIYPASDPFYVAHRYKSERTNIRNYSDMEPERVVRDLVRRTNVTFRNTLLFSIVAPRPLIVYEGAACEPFCVRVMRRSRGQYLYASYIGFGSLLARMWFVGFLIAGVLFARQLFKTPGQVTLQTALLLNILFNFLLHIRYGDDPLLYTPDWTYALVFFFGLSFERWRDSKWLQIILLLFLTGILVNNLGFFRKIFETMSPFFQ